MLGHKDPAPIFLREHLTRVEGHPETARVRVQLNLRIDNTGGHRGTFVLDRARGPPAIPGKAEALASPRPAVQFFWWDVVPHAVDLVVREPERLIGGAEVDANRIADPRRVDLAVLSVLIHADDAADPHLLVEVKLLLRRNVERLPKRDIELVV